MSSSTPYIPVRYPQATVTWLEMFESTDEAPQTSSATRGVRNLFGHFGSFAAPIVAAASILAPGVPATLRQTYSITDTTSGALHNLRWDTEDVWTMTSAWTTQAEIDSLNALFNLDLPDGSPVDVITDY